MKHRKTKKKGGKRLAFGGMLVKPDKQLALVIGKAAVAPSKMTKNLWTYIKKHKLLKR
ncbi:MAG: SWIB/MDM2 domain-containing protein [Nanoarchaeota archaeon]